MDNKAALKVVMDKLKAKGIVQAEEDLKKIVDAVFEGAAEYVALTDTPYDNLALPLLPMAKSIIDKALDFNKDGKVGA